MRSLSSKPRTAEATSGTEKKETLTYLSNANSPGRLGTGGVLDLDERPLEGPPPVLRPAAGLLLPSVLSILKQHGD